MLEGWDDFLTVEELCEILKIGRNAACTLLNSGELKALRNGRVWKVPKAADRSIKRIRKKLCITKNGLVWYNREN